MDFNKQASHYDKKVQLPDALPKAIAQTLLEYIPNNNAHTLLDVGVGTGEISIEVAKLPFSYVGFDKSTSMVEIFTNRYKTGEFRPNILVADGNKKWPVADNSVGVLFSSKALHLLDRAHVLSEIERIQSPDGLTLVIGSVRKQENGADWRMRKKMLALLEESGIKGKGGKKQREQFYNQCVAMGAQILPTTVVGKWDVLHAPMDSIRSWKRVDGLAGNSIKNKEDILHKLEAWAIDTYGDLTTKVKSFRAYELSGVTFSNNLNH